MKQLIQKACALVKVAFSREFARGCTSGMEKEEGLGPELE